MNNCITKTIDGLYPKRKNKYDVGKMIIYMIPKIIPGIFNFPCELIAIFNGELRLTIMPSINERSMNIAVYFGTLTNQMASIASIFSIIGNEIRNNKYRLNRDPLLIKSYVRSLSPAA